MLVGVPKEIMVHEYRAGLTPPNVRELTSRGHQVLVESGAGEGIGANDLQYELAGAQIAHSAAEVYDNAQLIVKVKEPLKTERKYLRPSHILFTYFHLAADNEETRDLIESGSTCIAYETVTSKDGKLPLLAPMSEVAGRMSVQVGAHHLEKKNGGSGVLLGGVPGLAPAKVVILGGGVVGTHAIHIAIGMGADVWVLDRNPDVLRSLWKQYGRSLKTVFATQDAVDSLIVGADLVIGGVLLAGAKAPKLVSEEVVRRMRPGSVIVDVAIDQGGCLETSRPTTHDAPTYTVGGVIHYCVTNMPGAVPKTSAFSLNNATLPYILALAEKGWKVALSDDSHLRNGLNVHAGKIACLPVAQAHRYKYVDAATLLTA